MLTAEQSAAFANQGFVRVPAAFSRENAAAMEERVWKFLERERGLSRGDPAGWPSGQVFGLQELKHQPVFDAIGSETTCGALDAVLDAGRWKRPRDWGGFLITFPSPGGWRVPHHVWHTDFDYHGRLDAPHGALVFSFLSDVPAGAGGTAVVAGSPRVIARFLETRPRASFAKMKSVRRALYAFDPWLTLLSSDDPDAARDARLMDEGGSVAGVAVRVVELTGEAGDLVIGHPWLLHASAPNRGSRPRIMRVQRIVRSAREEAATS